ncbi:MAG: hypothetical protein RQ756_04910 [Flavobacteriaceae bacterium]|nr:hypothetical protein [Flavobacteriaceae bacterium]
MQPQLNYRFKRRSKDFLDWLVNVVESNQYPDMESMVKTALGSDRTIRQY